MTDRTLKACPECDTTNIWRRGQGYTGEPKPITWCCKNQHEFSEPMERTAKPGGGLNGLAAKLDAMEVDDGG